MFQHLTVALLTVGIAFLTYPLWAMLLSKILAPSVVAEAERILSHE